MGKGDLDRTEERILNSHDSLNLLTALLWGEARGEDAVGKLAVAHVVNNRRIDNRWPDTFKDVILQPWQFSCFNPGDPNKEQVQIALMPSFDGNWGNLSWRECRWAAQSVISGLCRDFTKGANHYYASSIKTPRWAEGERACFMHGRHLFFAL